MECHTGKKQHSSKEKAMQFMKRVDNGRRMRAYYCLKCHSWHLTSQVEEKGLRKDSRKNLGYDDE